MRRVVQPELLDRLPASSPEAVRARADLRRINRLLGHARIITRLYERHLDLETARRRSLRISEMGAGDGWLMLQLARRWAQLGITADADLIDLKYLIPEQTREAFVELNWTAALITMDVRMWLAQPPLARSDLVLANLFLHHFEDGALREMFRHIADRAECFMACEPRRSDAALAASRLGWAMGCNAVTRHDAPVSVRAGFEGNELSALWPDPHRWLLIEEPAGWFSHCFLAKRVEPGI